MIVGILGQLCDQFLTLLRRQLCQSNGLSVQIPHQISDQLLQRSSGGIEALCSATSFLIAKSGYDLLSIAERRVLPSLARLIRSF